MNSITIRNNNGEFITYRSTSFHNFSNIFDYIKKKNNLIVYAPFLRKILQNKKCTDNFIILIIFFLHVQSYVCIVRMYVIISVHVK